MSNEIYLFNKKGAFIKSFCNLKLAVSYVIDNNISITKMKSEVTNKILYSLNNKVYSYGFIFSYDRYLILSEYKHEKEKSSEFNIGDIIKNDMNKYKIIKIDKYKEGITRFHLECLSCTNVKTTDLKGVLNISKCNKCSRNEFTKSNDGDYWIGITQQGEEFMFDGNEDLVKYIKGFTWRKTVHGYIQNRKGEKLHRIVMNVASPNIYVNHIGGNKSDCRSNNLSISDCLDNSKEKRTSVRNNTGIVGLMKRGKNDKYVGNIKINDMSIYSKYKERDDAILDLLIMQKHYGFRHNIDMFHMIENISNDRYNEVIENCERQLRKQANHTIKSGNKIELSNCKTFYWVYDDDENKINNKFKISLESLGIVELGKWHISQDNISGKQYVHGTIVVEGKRKAVKLHRYILGLMDVKYKRWFVDHVNGDGLDNTVQNLCITDSKGNGHKSVGKGYIERKERPGVYRVNISLGGIRYDKTFYSEEEAKDYVLTVRNNFFNNRLEFKSKLDLDKYIA